MKMTSQQKADAWLTVWQALRALGMSPAEREAVIRREIDRYHEERFFKAMSQIRDNLSHMSNST